MFDGEERVCGGDGVWFCRVILRGNRNEVSGRLSWSSLGHGVYGEDGAVERVTQPLVGI